VPMPSLKAKHLDSNPSSLSGEAPNNFFWPKKPLIINGLSLIYNLQLLPKSKFEPRTPKPDNFGPPTLETVQFSTLGWFQKRFSIFGKRWNFTLFLSILTSSNKKKLKTTKL
jgi:hypothetical protein